MDGNPPASALPRLAIAAGLAILCWMALWVWTSQSRNELPNTRAYVEFDVTEPGGEPLIDWNLFRFPTLEVSLEGLENPAAPDSGSLLDLLEPQRIPAIAEGDSAVVPPLQFSCLPARRPMIDLPPAVSDQLAAARGSADWFPAHGADHPWSLFGLNSSRAWIELGRLWSRHAPQDPTAQITRWSALAVRQIARSKPPATVRLVGPQLISSAGDRLAMIPPKPTACESATEIDLLRFAEPTTLLAQIEMLAGHPWTSRWASDADREIRRLCTGATHGGEDMAQTLKRLALLTRQAREIADDCRDPSLQAELMQAHYGLSRRMSRWQIAADLHGRRTNLWARRSIHERLLAKIDAGTLAVDDPAAIESLRETVSAGRPLSGEQRRELSQAILASARLAHRGSDAIASLSGALDDELRLLAADTVDVSQLFANLESLESNGSPLVAGDIAADRRQLLVSVDERQRQLASEIEEHYRNANLRFAVSGELLNRWLPEQSPVEQPVRDRIAGSPVRGRSRTQTELFVRLIPDPFIWRVGLEASGEVDARTTSGEGSVQVRTEGATTFLARKLLLVRADGVQAWPAIAEADASQRLLGIASSYDQVPFMGSYVRSQANEEYQRRREQARREVEAKVAGRARQTLDEQATNWLADIERRARTRILKQAEELELQITPIELRTTDTRLIARLRLANENQLSAYTPRPQAPADSLLSLQLHETAINNALIGLQLTGRSWTGTELAELLADKFERAAAELPEAARRTEIQFANDGLQAHFVEGRLHLTLAVREMVHDRTAVRNFKVHLIYRPEIEGLSAKLVRDGSLQMEGRLRHTDRARLHAVFGKALDEISTLELVRLPADADTAQRLAGLMVTQLVIDDGWLGLSIGPANANRTAVRTRFVR